METHIDSAGHNAAAIHHRSIFDLPPNFFDSCRLLESPSTVGFDVFPVVPTANNVVEEREAVTAGGGGGGGVGERWSCNSCKQSFESLQEQRAHFKSDFHRFNIKLSIAGKDTMKEEDFDELTSDSLCKDYDISSISGSDDEDDKESGLRNEFNKGTLGSLKRKVFVHLQTGERVSLWKCLLVGYSERISFQHDKSGAMENNGKPFLVEKEVTEKLRHLIHEPRDNSHLRVVLLARGGHFAGCVFDGNSIVAHKTFHRYVIRAKAGKKQSSKDASGKTAHSAGASMRRHNELSLKKDIRELLASWKPYFDYSSCILVHAPSNNRQLLFDGEKPYFSCQPGGVRSIPLTVRRPTLKEARRIYNILTQISRETDEEIEPVLDGTSELGANIVDDDFKESNKDILQNHLDGREIVDVCSHVKELEVLSISSEAESEAVPTSTALHEAAKSGNAEFVLELLEQGMDPCMKDERGRTPYMLATEKEVRNTFRRFMASNVDKWDWQAAKVPSPLTKEMEESQTAKQAEKDAKRKARAKELKKLRKAKEKKAQAEASQSQNAASIPDNSRGTQISRSSGARMSREEELKRAQDEEREKRAAAAERRIAALKSAALTTAPTSSQQTSADINCSCCHASLAGKVPFHRYNYKYCSTSCMHVHREIIEDG